MKKLSKKQYSIILSGITILFMSTLIFISPPYLNNWRSQYSLYIETKADLNPDKQRALLQYLEANLFSDSELLSLKIGQFYDDAGKPELAEKYFTKVKSSKYLNDLTEHYFRAGDIEKAKTIAQKTNDEYYNTLILFINNPKEAINAISDPKDKKTKELKQYIETFINNPQKEYTDTAIASYLYNHDYEKLALRKLMSYQDKNYRDALVLLGDIYYKTGEYKKSATAYEKSITLDQFDLDAYKKLQSVYQKTKDTQKIDNTKLKIKNLSIYILN